MKNVYRRLGIIVVVAIIGFYFASCSTGGGGGTGSGINVTVNNLPSDAVEVSLGLMDTGSGENYVTIDPKKPPISGNSVSATFYKDDFGFDIAPFITNDDPVAVTIDIYSGEDSGHYYSYGEYTFSDSTVVLTFPNDFTNDYPF